MQAKPNWSRELKVCVLCVDTRFAIGTKFSIPLPPANLHFIRCPLFTDKIRLFEQRLGRERDSGFALWQYFVNPLPWPSSPQRAFSWHRKGVRGSRRHGRMGNSQWKGRKGGRGRGGREGEAWRDSSEWQIALRV
jgi:hypothetical protein